MYPVKTNGHISVTNYEHTLYIHYVIVEGRFVGFAGFRITVRLRWFSHFIVSMTDMSALSVASCPLAPSQNLEREREQS